MGESTKPNRSRADTNESGQEQELSVDILTTSEFSELLVQSRNARLPEPNLMFPWLYGISADNSQTREYFTFYGYKIGDAVPVFAKGLLPVVCGNLVPHEYEIKGAVHAQDLLQKNLLDGQFRGAFQDLEIHNGIAIRNYRCQSVKTAQCCDVVVFVPPIPDELSWQRSRRVKGAQDIALKLQEAQKKSGSVCKTFFYPELMAEVVNSMPSRDQDLVMMFPPEPKNGNKFSKTSSSNRKLRSQVQERASYCWDFEFRVAEMDLLNEMTAASEICPNVWLGNSLDSSYLKNTEFLNRNGIENEYFGCGIGLSTRLDEVMLVDCNYGCENFPSMDFLDAEIAKARKDEQLDRLDLLFPGTYHDFWPRLTDTQTLQVVNTCRLIYARSQKAPVLIVCNDGYRASSLLAVLYTMYTLALPVEESLLHLFKTKSRSFSLAPLDVELLTMVQPTLVRASPIVAAPAPSAPASPLPASPTPSASSSATPASATPVSATPASATPASVIPVPSDPVHSNWLEFFDGSFPSRILPYLYFGGYKHAKNQGMLKALGIKRVISIGACPFGDSPDGDFECLRLTNFIDDGLSGLSTYLDECLEFLSVSREHAIPTLVHCQQGVSRSAAVCIAEVMRSQEIVLPHAYLLTRVRRLDILIQPNLRLMYDLCRFEESLFHKRSIEWPALCREIALINETYLNQ